MFNSTNDLMERFNVSQTLEKLNVTKTLYSKFDKEAEKSLSQTLIREALDEVYSRGDKVMIGFVGLHYLLGLLFAAIHNDSWRLYGFLGTAVLLIFLGIVFFYPKKFFTRVMAGVALMSYILLYIHLLKGLPEVRFFFFTSFTILIVYQDWRSLWPTALILYIQILVFTYLGGYADSLPFVTEEYKDLVLRVAGVKQGENVNWRGIGFYVGISSLQVMLAGVWAHFLKRQTIGEVLSKQAILTKQLEIEKANEQLENNVKKKTQELQAALEQTQANEEELRQNMEELTATQDEMENQRNKLLENQEKMQEVQQELQERQSKMERSQWLESNLSRFDDIMRLSYDKGLEELSDKIMLNLSELLNATQGAFYVYDEEEGLLKMTGGYACTPQTVKKATFKMGEGILGQMVKTKKTTYLSDLPDEGAITESALTRVRSKSIAIVPMLYNEDIQGVIEIALLHQIDDLHKEFLERMAKNVATMLQSIRGILRTQKLLKQSQEITSQLRANARELEKTKQEEEQRALEFQSQFKAIDRSMLVLECTPEGEILDANENFLKLSKYQPQEMIGKHESIFLAGHYAHTSDYQELWNRIRNYQFVDTEHECVAKDGKSFWMKANYYTLGTGRKTKVMVLAYDTTREKEQDIRILEHLEALKKKEEQTEKHLQEVEHLRDEVEKKANELQEQMNAINVSTAMVEYDPKGFIRYVNDKFLEISGYRPKDLMGKSHQILVEDKFAQSKAYAKFWERLHKKEFIEGEFEIKTKKQEGRWLRGSYYPICDRAGQLSKVMLLASDITQEVQQEEKIKQYLLDLEKAKAKLKDKTMELRAQINAIDRAIGVLEMNPEGKILRANEQFLKLSNYKNGELSGKHHRVLLDKKDAASPAYRKFWEKLNQNQFVENDFTAITKDKSELQLRGSYFPVLDAGEKVTKIIAIIARASSS